MRLTLFLAALIAFSAPTDRAVAQATSPSNVFASVSASSPCDLSNTLVCTMQFRPIKLGADIALRNYSTGAVQFLRAQQGVGDTRVEPGVYEVTLLWHSQMRGAPISAFTIEPRTIQVDLLPNGQISQFLTPFRVRIKRPVHELTGSSGATALVQ